MVPRFVPSGPVIYFATVTGNLTTLAIVMRTLVLAVWLLAVGCPALAVEFPTNVRDHMRVDALDWPWWRGPQRNGSAFPKQDPPRRWSEQENVIWKTPLPGRGHGSPTVVGDRVYVGTADRQRDVQTVLCFGRANGNQLWEYVAHRGGIMKKNEKASQASSTVAWDGDRLFMNFLNDGAIYTTALSADGKKLWQRRINDYVIHQGYASSPAIYQNLVIVTADNKGGGAIVALNRATGDEVWRRDRPKFPNYSSPIIVNAAGKDQVIMIGCREVVSFDPLTGQTNWQTKGSTEECVTSTVTDGLHVYSSGGYPDNHVSAIRADGTGEAVWRVKNRVYVPSLLIKDGYLYGIMDAGVVVCWMGQTGQELWKGRLGGTFSASPVLVGDLIYATNESGETFIIKAQHSGFELVGKNQLGADVYATQTICGDRIYTRVGMFEGGNRREYLYCLGVR